MMFQSPGGVREPQLFPIPKQEPEPIVSDFIDENEQMNWVMFVVGFAIGCIATVVMVIAR